MCSESYVSQTENMVGPLGIDYHYAYSCSFSGYSFLFYFLIFLWVIFLMSMLAHTASNYFSPTLGSICDKLNLAYDIAGVTFLALGNGAPDFFSLIASFSGDVDVLVAVGALLGGGVFISTIVVGLVATFCPCEVSKYVFLRDISFHLFAVFCVSFIALIRNVHIAIAISFLFFYCVYVATVTSASLMKSLRKKDRSKKPSVSGDVALSTFNSNAVQTAFWHKSATSSVLSSHGMGEEAKDPLAGPPQSQPQSHAAPGGYSFLIVDPDEDDDEDNAKSTAGDDDEEEGGRTKNISGGFAPAFELIIDENYYSLQNSLLHDNEEEGDGQEDSRDDAGSGSGSNPLIRKSGSLTESLLPNAALSSDDASEPTVLDGVLDGSVGARSLKKSDRRLYKNVINFLYWRQWMLQRRVRHGLCSVSEWQRYSLARKCLVLLWLPGTVARDLTIPTLDDQNWSKLYAVCHPFTIPLFIQFLLGFSHRKVGPVPVPALCLLAGIAPACVVYVMTHQVRPPSFGAPSFPCLNLNLICVEQGAQGEVVQHPVVAAGLRHVHLLDLHAGGRADLVSVQSGGHPELAAGLPGPHGAGLGELRGRPVHEYRRGAAGPGRDGHGGLLRGPHFQHPGGAGRFPGIRGLQELSQALLLRAGYVLHPVAGLPVSVAVLHNGHRELQKLQDRSVVWNIFGHFVYFVFALPSNFGGILIGLIIIH